MPRYAVFGGPVFGRQVDDLPFHRRSHFKPLDDRGLLNIKDHRLKGGAAESSAGDRHVRTTHQPRPNLGFTPQGRGARDQSRRLRAVSSAITTRQLLHDIYGTADRTNQLLGKIAEQELIKPRAFGEPDGGQVNLILVHERYHPFDEPSSHDMRAKLNPLAFLRRRRAEATIKAHR